MGKESEQRAEACTMCSGRVTARSVEFGTKTKSTARVANGEQHNRRRLGRSAGRRRSWWLGLATATTLQLEEVECLKIDALKAAVLGAEVVSDALDKPKQIEEKGGSADIVTLTDKKTEEVILDYIQKRYPDHLVLGEEGGLKGN